MQKTILFSLGIVWRLLPHLFNATPTEAVGILSGAKLEGKWKWGVPFLSLLISDIVLNTFYGFSAWFYLVPFIYGSYAITIFLGKFVRGNKKWGKLFSVTLISSVQFFLITNVGVWLVTPAYAKTLAGFADCFWMALPFFRNSLLGTFAWTAGLYFILNKVEVFATISEKNKLGSPHGR